ncbi:PREDICTED: NAD(P)H-quinone oxidoreductase subunit M, chloroplastic [Ipomoea nil]|uniref:NAD(P)H-quinone oxidoreductase subunit M, chloroplastic n=1 Tax=Ipomoea nil TaxID=35883 RepID=UPI000901716F|nr:PREDICTED: NAD(P)H-quinone oxidoreductase subunit M, chloroplastic [Ipomoea nil]
MATASSYMARPTLSMMGGWSKASNMRKRIGFTVSASSSSSSGVEEEQEEASAEVKVEEDINQAQEPQKKLEEGMKTPLRPVEAQINVKNRNMGREYGGQWLSSTTRHVRIFAAYIDPDTCAFDQTQMDKLTLILDPTDEFLWTDETCNKVYSYFQELVDHYEGAPLTEYTLRLIGSDIEHYIRRLLYAGEIQYNMDARVLNFSMGKPRIGFNYDGKLQDVNQ